MAVFSVNDAGEALLLVHVDGIPDFGDPGTGSVDDFDVLSVRFEKYTMCEFSTVAKVGMAWISM